MLDKSVLIKIIKELDNPMIEVINDEAVMDAYHQLDDMGQYYLSELIDNFILGKLDAPQTEIFEKHLLACDKCKKELALMSMFIRGVKELCDDSMESSSGK